MIPDAERNNQMHLLDQPVSLFKSIYDNDTPGEHLLLSEVLDRIHQGTWRTAITRLRRTLASGGEAAYKRQVVF